MQTVLGFLAYKIDSSFFLLVSFLALLYRISRFFIPSFTCMCCSFFCCVILKSLIHAQFFIFSLLFTNVLCILFFLSIYHNFFLRTRLQALLTVVYGSSLQIFQVTSDIFLGKKLEPLPSESLPVFHLRKSSSLNRRYITSAVERVSTLESCSVVN